MNRRTFLTALLGTATSLVAGCGSDSGSAADGQPDTLKVDFATYNPLSLVIRDQGWLEAALPGTSVNWIQSLGSNKANENLRAGAVDVASTAGSAALLARANGSPIRTIDIFSRPEWAALVVPGNSPITEVRQLAGRKVAVTKGTDPYFFLLQALDRAGVRRTDVTIENLQHADGRAALENGSVDAWSGLDPLMAASQAQAGSKLLYRNVDYNTYGFLNATESFLSKHPGTAQLVVDTYERARAWAGQHPEDTAAILATVAGIDLAVARATLHRTKLDVEPAPGEPQRAVLRRVGPILVASGDVAKQSDVDVALDSLFAPALAAASDPARITAAAERP